MIVKRTKSFSLRERNRIREKASAAKSLLDERNRGLEVETGEEHNTFHDTASKNHQAHTRPRLYRNFSKREYPYEYNPNYSSKDYFKEIKTSGRLIKSSIRPLVNPQGVINDRIKDGSYTILPTKE